MDKKYTQKEWADKWKLDEEEREILRASEAGELESLPSEEAKKMTEMLEKAAHATLKELKTKSISIRISPTDLELIKTRAKEEGIPYQTLIGSLIHKYVRKRPGVVADEPKR